MPTMNSPVGCPNCAKPYAYLTQGYVACLHCKYERYVGLPTQIIRHEPTKGGTVRSEQDYSHSP